MDIYTHGDPRDRYDSVKWDFDDSMLTEIYGSDGYIYKLARPSSDKLVILEGIRGIASDIATYLLENIDTFPKDVRNGLVLFAQVHGEYPITKDLVEDMSEVQYNLMKNHINTHGTFSNVIYNEIPRGTTFRGINKPMERYLSGEPEIGKDKNLRSKYRQVYFDLGTRDLRSLVIHELAHTAANHQRWRMDDHGADFRRYETIIRNAWRDVTK